MSNLSTIFQQLHHFLPRYQTRYSYSLLEFSRIIGEALFLRCDLIDLLSLNYSNFRKIRDSDPQIELEF